MTDEAGIAASKPPRIYVAGPYSAPTEEGRDRNVFLALDAGAELMKLGYDVIVPHGNTYQFESYGIPQERFMEMDFRLIDVCDGVYLLRRWAESPGARREFEYAHDHGKRVYWQGCQEPPPMEEWT